MLKLLLVTLGAALALCGAALAAPTLVGTTTNATGIDGVVVDSVTYDVTFSTSSFDSTFSTAMGASDAADALAADLNTLSVVSLSPSGFDCDMNTCGIWAGASPQLAGAFFFSPPSPWDAGFSGKVSSPGCPQTITGGLSVCFEAAHWTKVTSSSVPEPATLALLGLALVGLGLFRRRLAH